MQKMSLSDLADEQLQRAFAGTSGRASVAAVGGRGRVLRQTVVALTSGSSLSEHNNPGEATLLVLHGHVLLTSGAEACDGRDGDLLLIPPSAHSLSALSDSTVLLTTVALPHAQERR